MKTIAAIFLAVLLPLITLAGPPYDIAVTFDPPLTGGAPVGFNLYIDDCAVTGPIAAPFGTVTTGQTFVGALTLDGTYAICVRAFNSAGEPPNPGPVATVTVADVPLPGTVQNLNVTASCPNGGCTVIVTIN